METNKLPKSWCVRCTTDTPAECIPEVLEYLGKVKEYKDITNNYYVNRCFGLDIYGSFDTWCKKEYIDKYFKVILTYEEFLECINLKQEIVYEVY